MGPNPDARDAYEILGLPRSAGIEDVRNAFRKLALRYHPDVAGGDDPAEAQRVFVRISKAYEVLQDPETRRRYDRLLAGGMIPDLDREIPNEPPPRPLHEILGEIDSLDMPADEAALLKAVDYRLRQVLDSRLFHDGPNRIERILDVTRFYGVANSSGYEKPPGSLTQGWLVATNLRAILLSWNTNVYQVGNTKHTDYHYRIVGILFVALKHLRLHTSSRTRSRDKLEAEDESGTSVTVDFPASKVPRLLLITGAYRLPLRVRDRSRLGRTLAWALTKSLWPAMAWFIPFLFLGMRDLFTKLTGGQPGQAGWYEYESWYTWLNANYLTTAALYLTGPLLAYQWWRLDRDWNDAVKAEDVLGRLPADYALGRDAATQAREGGGPLAEVLEPEDLALRWLTARLAAEGVTASPAPASPPMARH